MVRTGKGKNALTKMTLLQPLSLVEVSFDPDSRKGLQTPRVLDREKVLNGIPFDTIKTCIALFIAEVVGRSIAEEERNPSMFKFLKGAVLKLDAETNHVTNYHLKFMVDFTRYLGFYPQHPKTGQKYFDLAAGEFTDYEAMHPYILGEDLATQLQKLMEIQFDMHHTVRIGNDNRRALLQKLIDYYRIHLDGMKEITSHKVLEEVLA